MGGCTRMKEPEEEVQTPIKIPKKTHKKAKKQAIDKDIPLGKYLSDIIIKRVEDEND